MDDEYRSHSPPYSPNTPPPHAEAPQPPLPIPSALSMLASMLRSKDEAKDGATPSAAAPRPIPERAAMATEASREPASPADEEGVMMPDQSPTAWRQHLGVLPKELVVIDECEGDEDGGQPV
jgi:hypothetical protein